RRRAWRRCRPRCAPPTTSSASTTAAQAAETTSASAFGPEHFGAGCWTPLAWRRWDAGRACSTWPRARASWPLSCAASTPCRPPRWSRDSCSFKSASPGSREATTTGTRRWRATTRAWTKAPEIWPRGCRSHLAPCSSRTTSASRSRTACWTSSARRLSRRG
ncbi:hypothetical protein H632_c5152p0, partial [Helicosporidium sp. ATCC 50920]